MKIANMDPSPRGALEASQPPIPPALTPEHWQSPTLPESQGHPPEPSEAIQSSRVLFDGALVDVGELFRSLPTRVDLKALVVDLKEEPQRETHQLQEKIAIIQITTKVHEVATKAV